MMKYDPLQRYQSLVLAFPYKKTYYFAPGMSNGNNKYKVYWRVMISIVDEF